MILAVGDHHHLHTLPDGGSIYECKIFVTEQKVAGVLSKANITCCHLIQSQSLNPHPKNSSKHFIFCLSKRPHKVNLDGKVPYSQ